MNLLKINPFEQTSIVKKIVRVYQQAFGGAPWYEGYVCPVCQETFAASVQDVFCPRCAQRNKSIYLVEYWPEQKVLSDFYQEMLKPQSICVAGLDGSGVIGFAWGYEVTIGKELSDYLCSPNLEALVQGNFFYLDECAISPVAQGKGYGKSLVQFIFGQQDNKRILLRTKMNSRMYDLIRHLKGEVIMRISEERVIMALVLG